MHARHLTDTRIVTAVTDAWPSLTIGEFEHVPAGSDGVLLRVSGRLPAAGANPERRPGLLADGGRGVERFEALPAPTDVAGVLRAAYAVPATLIAGNARFWLDPGDGSTVRLPAPTPGIARRAAAGGPAPDASERLDTLSAALTEARGRTAGLRAENEKLSATLEELEIWRGELERRLSDTTTELAETRARLAEARAAAEMEALVARAEAAALEQAAHELIEAADRTPSGA